MALARIEPPEQGWGPVRLYAAWLHRLGYHTEDQRSWGADGPVSTLLIS